MDQHLQTDPMTSFMCAIYWCAFDIITEVFKTLSGEQSIDHGVGDVKDDHDNEKLPIVWLILDIDQSAKIL